MFQLRNCYIVKSVSCQMILLFIQKQVLYKINQRCSRIFFFDINSIADDGYGSPLGDPLSSYGNSNANGVTSSRRGRKFPFRQSGHKSKFSIWLLMLYLDSLVYYVFDIYCREKFQNWPWLTEAEENSPSSSPIYKVSVIFC